MGNKENKKKLKACVGVTLDELYKRGDLPENCHLFDRQEMEEWANRNGKTPFVPWGNEGGPIVKKYAKDSGEQGDGDSSTTGESGRMESSGAQ